MLTPDRIKEKVFINTFVSLVMPWVDGQVLNSYLISCMENAWKITLIEWRLINVHI